MKPWQIQLAAVLASLAVTSGMVGAYNHFQREIGKRDILTAQAKVGELAARRELDSLTKAQKPQTAAAVRTLVKWDTVKAGIDTTWLRDTVPVPVEVVRTIVVSADTGIKSCTMARLTCEERVGAAQRGWDKAEDRIKQLEHQMPGKLTPLRHRAEGAVVGFVVSWLANQLKRPR